ncbi:MULTISPECIES: MerR family transcriptional regulator [Fictibacillus]|uniref:Chromosome-anchoring protein RacA n=1 Tax=Fictibacillus terranigra TaxID=3058424 RepID=A0ABT8E9D6_9BACL|nr:MerR family transcriptional regulator [Fictibacillus sp. CENA-BCM004]MDN4074520.1 MerR family transcriptional regulator [Fictibacillus sp. CENA-BCM004]
MEMVFKTKTVSEELGVNPTTIQRWVKHFNLTCQKNDHGHYLFSEQDIEDLREIKKQLDAGLLMNDIQIAAQVKSPEAPVKAGKFDERFESLMTQIEKLEKKIEEKADDVLSYQVLQHATEMDDMMKRLIKIEEKIEDIEVKLLKMPQGPEETAEYKKPRRNWLVSLFTL